ncbi:MAG: transglycosylase SLT domain-containing protein [Acidithiobacillus sp.]|nr:transglycosylase SLT domain-containing protein [Acidithiobacillus sp.]
MAGFNLLGGRALGVLFCSGFLCQAPAHIPVVSHLKPVVLQKAMQRSEPLHSPANALKKLAGPYAGLVLSAATKAHVSPVLVAAVVYVENGGNFVGSTTRVSSAGAIGVMQLEPVTAWDVLHVNPWQAASNINGGARFISMLMQRFHGNTRLALMAYNAGPTLIGSGGRPAIAVYYAQKVMQLTQETRL